MRAWLYKIVFFIKNHNRPHNRFGVNEWSGAVGDLGTLMPLAFALIVFNGFSSATIFFLFGLIYIATGWFYRVPVSVQPLKAMSVIAIAQGYSPQFLATTSFLYGMLFLILSISGLIRWLQKWFSPALVGGIQLGIGLILTKKALELVWQNGFLLHTGNVSLWLNFVLLFLFLLLIWRFQIRKNVPIALILIFSFISVFILLKIKIPLPAGHHLSLHLFKPDLRFWKDALIFLIIPQLPLTLGNAVYAASDACHALWGEQAQRVTPTRLAFSIGLSDAFIGLLGGFPVCHGAGGMGAHAQFGARTGGATIIMGGILLISSLIPTLNQLIFLIPVPLLAAMLILVGYRMIVMVRTLPDRVSLSVAFIVGLISFANYNLTIALIAGFLLENFLKSLIKTRIIGGVKND